MSDILSLRENSSYNLRCGATVNRRNITTSKFDFETDSTIGTMLWNDLPAELKSAESLNIFKQKIKLCSPNDYPCKICRKFKKFGIILTSKTKKKKKILKLLRKKPAVTQ